MRGPKPTEVIVSDRQRAILERLARATTAPASLVERCRILLFASSGMPTLTVATQMDVDRQRVRRGRRRWADELRPRLDGVEAAGSDKDLVSAIEEALSDAPRSGAPPRFTDEQIALVRAIACQSPQDHGLPHSQWTRGLLAQIAVQKGIVSSVSVAEIGRWLKKGGLSHT